MDFAQARYFSSVQGRFTSPDIFGGRLTNPQTLNLYAYVLNNPLKWADPTGHFQEKPKDDPYRNDPCGGQPCEPYDRSSVVDTIVTSQSYLNFTTSLVPIYGPARQADFEFRTGHPIKGTFYTAMAISDIAMVKSLCMAGGKICLKMFGKVAGDETTELIIKDTLVETGVKIGDDAVPTFINLGDNAAGEVIGNLSISPNGYRLPSGELANGTFDFVVQGGNVRVGYGHPALSQGAPVTWAGQITFSKGALVNWTNVSGHFRPAAAFAGNAGLPMELFRPISISAWVGGPQFPIFR